MKSLIAIALMALVVLMPFAFGATQQDNEILPVIGDDAVKVREQLRTRFLGEETFRNQLKTQVTNCIGTDSTECEQVRSNVREIAKGVLTNVCTVREEALTNLKTRVQESTRLSNEEKATAVEVVDAQTAQLQKVCNQVETADTAKLKEVTQEIKQSTKESKVKFELAKRLIHWRRIGLIIERAEHLEEKLQSFIEKWNCSTEELQPLIDSFNAKVAEARTAYDEGKVFWEQFKESVKQGDPDTELLSQAKEKMQFAQLKLKEAHVILKDIIVELHECKNPEVEPEEAEPVEPVEEPETEE